MESDIHLLVPWCATTYTRVDVANPVISCSAFPLVSCLPSIRQVIDLSLKLCNALEYLHDVAVPGRIVCHRDLKPDNIAFAENGNLKLIDFGLGKVRNPNASESILLSVPMFHPASYKAPFVSLDTTGSPLDNSCFVQKDTWSWKTAHSTPLAPLRTCRQ